MAHGQPLLTNGPELALELVQLGFHVVPTSAPIMGDRASGKNSAVGGEDWWAKAQDSTTLTPERYQGRNVGIACGKPVPGGGFLFVFDPDVSKGDGLAELSTWAEAQGGLPHTFTVATGSGGRHIYLRTRAPAGGSKLGLTYVDTRGTGGQVVAPGCYHHSGALYVVEHDCGIAWAPEWLETLLTTWRPTRKTGVDLTQYPAVELTRELLAQRARELGPLHGSYPRIMALACGKPIGGPGNRHDAIDCRLMTELVNEFTPGITDESVVQLLAPSYPEGVSRKNHDSLLDGLCTARGKYQPKPTLESLIGLGKVFETTPAVVTGTALALIPALVDPPVELKDHHCDSQAKKIGAKSANGAAERKTWWKALSSQHPGGILPSELAGVLEMIARAYPTAVADSVFQLVGRVSGATPEQLSPLWVAAHKTIAEDQERFQDPTKRDIYEKAKVILGDNGGPAPLPLNVLVIARAFLGQCLRVNVRGHLLECRGLPWDTTSTWREWSDADDNHCVEWFGRQHGIPLGPERVRPAVATAADSNPVDPFHTWLDALPTWDGQPRLEHWLHKAAGAQDCAYTRAVSVRFLLSIVARSDKPGCKVDTKLVLVGPQGAGKSTLLRDLVGQSFFDSTVKDSKESSKDYLAKLHRCVLHEDAEMSTYSAADVSSDKALLSNAVDTFRPPYGRSAVTYPRRFVLAGSTNDTEGFLRDSTGARRYWPVSVGSIDLKWLALAREQLWAEAVARYVRGEQWWLTVAEELPAAEVQEEHRDRDVWEEELLTLIEAPGQAFRGETENGRIRSLTTNDAWCLLEKASANRSISRAEQTRIGKVLRVIGWGPRDEGLRPRRYYKR